MSQDILNRVHELNDNLNQNVVNALLKLDFVKTGEGVAIVGSTFSGRSTLANEIYKAAVAAGLDCHRLKAPSPIEVSPIKGKDLDRLLTTELLVIDDFDLWLKLAPSMLFILATRDKMRRSTVLNVDADGLFQLQNQPIHRGMVETLSKGGHALAFAIRRLFRDSMGIHQSYDRLSDVFALLGIWWQPKFDFGKRPTFEKVSIPDEVGARALVADLGIFPCSWANPQKLIELSSSPNPYNVWHVLYTGCNSQRMID